MLCTGASPTRRGSDQTRSYKLVLDRRTPSLVVEVTCSVQEVEIGIVDGRAKEVKVRDLKI